MRAITKTHLHPSKLTQSLQLFTPEEFKNFHKWLQSPWANANKKLVECYALLQKHHPTFDAKSLAKEDLFAKLYPGKKYDDKWMRNIMGGLAKQVEKFLVHQRLEKDEILTKQLLAKEYRERHHSDWFEKQAKDIVKTLEAKKVKETEDYLGLALIHEDMFHHSKSAHEHATGNTPLQIAELYLDTYYSISKWRHLSELVERQLILRGNLVMTDKIEQLVSLTKHLNIPVINIYRERVDAINELQIETFFVLKKNYLHYFDQLSLWDRKILLFSLINHAIRLWLKGDQRILEDLFSLYKMGIEKKLLFLYDRLTESSYTNIVTTANSVGEFKYCKYFIDNYTGALPPETKDEAKIWAMGHWHYKQNDPFKAIEFLGACFFKDNVLTRYSKMLLLQCYFDACLKDRSYFLFFNDYCEAFKKYIKRTKTISSQRKLGWHNLVRFSHQVLNVMVEKGGNVDKLIFLETELEAEIQIQGKQWLVNKLNEMKKGLPK